MKPDEIKNAKITDTFLGIEDHGMLIYSIELTYRDGVQWFQRVPHKDNLQTDLKAILKTIGVDSWDKLKGKYVRAFIHDTFIEALGHIVENKWTDGVER